jgi:hypothetical protein
LDAVVSFKVEAFLVVAKTNRLDLQFRFINAAIVKSQRKSVVVQDEKYWVVKMAQANVRCPKE